MKVEATEDGLVQAFARAVEKAGGKALLVGGLVRDEILGLPSKDVDFEIFGLPMEQVQQILSQFGNVKEVGQQFGVLNIQELDWDVALPRREQKTGEGHKGFDVVPDPSMTVEDAARRRDLTINAISKDPLTGEIIDPLNGLADLEAGVLRMADPHTFGDDPLRALRVAQFAARFDFDVDPGTLAVMAVQPLEELPGERILPEFSKMLLKGQKPSKGIEILQQANLLRYFPEIEALQGVPQDENHHPEGDVFIHTMMVLDEAAKQRTGDPAFDLPLMLGALAHDFGKPEFTQIENERIKAHGHEEGGEAPAREFLGRMKAPNELTEQVSALVSKHLRPVLMPERAGRKGYRRLGRELEKAGVSSELLVAVSKADTLGRTTEKALRRDTSLQDLFLGEYKQHVTDSIQPGQEGMVDSVSGKHLIARGMKPGPDMGKFLALTRSIEDETGLTDPDKLIDLAARFLSDRSEGGGSQQENENDCGDSHIRPGEECFDGDYREMRKQGKTKSTLASDFFDWTEARPCGDDEQYPGKCTEGPDSWELPPEDTTPYMPGQELALPPELQEPAAPVPAPERQLGPDAWNLPFSSDELNNPKQRAADEKMLKKTEKDATKNQNDADKAMLKKTLEDQKAQKLQDKAAQDAKKLQDKAAQDSQKLRDKAAQDSQKLQDKYAKNRQKRDSRPPETELKPEHNVPNPGSSWQDLLKYITGVDPKMQEQMPQAADTATGTGVGPSGFRTHPDKTQPDFLLWEQFEMPADQKGKALHPGLAGVSLGDPRPCYPDEEPVKDHCNDDIAPPSSAGGSLTEQDSLLINDQSRLQHADSPEQIQGLTDAWNAAKSAIHQNPDSMSDPEQAEQFALQLAATIEPRNSGGYRKVPVTFGPGKPPALDPELVPRAMEGLFGAYADKVMDPDEWYHEFEKVHPLEDGNGRLGDLLWKMDKVRRGEPWPVTHPPDFFGTDKSEYTAGLVTAEPQRLHERTNKYPGVKDFDRGSRFSEHPLEGPLGRDGFGGTTPAPMKELKDRPNGMTPETGIFPDWTDSDLEGHGQPELAPTHPRDHSIPELPATDPEEFNIDLLDWDTPPTQSDVSPDSRTAFPGGDEFPKSEPPNDKGAGFLATQLPLPQLLDTDTPYPSPVRTENDDGSPPSSFPGQSVRKPGGGGLDRAPMMKPNGAPQETGFQPIQNLPQPDRNMFWAETVEAFDPMDVHGPGGQNPGGSDMDKGRRGRGGRGGGTKIRPYWDMDFTGKKSGFQSIEPPEENVYPADVGVEAARTMEDLMDIDSIFPKDYNPERNKEGVSMPPHIGHQNKRKTKDMGQDPFPGEDAFPVRADDDSNIEQKQVQPLVPNQKMAIAVDPKGPMGERIVMMSPLFEQVSPAIMALRSQRFEKHGGVVVDGPPEWLISVGPRLMALDNESANEGAEDLFAQVMNLVQQSGLTVEYEQEPRP